MNIYTIKNEYIEFLRQYDYKVAKNKNESRPYVGVILTINEIKYYAPFTSPKRKHETMHNTKDFRKIAGGRLGAINLNNMIPVLDSAILPIHINDVENQQYRRLLQNQYAAIQQDSESIILAAERLYSLIFTPDESLTMNDKKIKNRCCNLPLLESIYVNWESEM